MADVQTKKIFFKGMLAFSRNLTLRFIMC